MRQESSSFISSTQMFVSEPVTDLTMAEMQYYIENVQYLRQYLRISFITCICLPYANTHLMSTEVFDIILSPSAFVSFRSILGLLV